MELLCRERRQGARVRCALSGARSAAASQSANVFRARLGARQANPRRWVRRQGHLLLRQEWPRDAEHPEGYHLDHHRNARRAGQDRARAGEITREENSREIVEGVYVRYLSAPGEDNTRTRPPEYFRATSTVPVDTRATLSRAGSIHTRASLAG